MEVRRQYGSYGSTVGAVLLQDPLFAGVLLCGGAWGSLWSAEELLAAQCLFSDLEKQGL